MLAQGEKKSEWMNEWATAWITKKSKFQGEKKEREQKRKRKKGYCEKESEARSYVCQWESASCSVAVKTEDGEEKQRASPGVTSTKWRLYYMKKQKTTHGHQRQHPQRCHPKKRSDSNKSVAKMESQSCVMCMWIGYVSCTCEKQLGQIALTSNVILLYFVCEWDIFGLGFFLSSSIFLLPFFSFWRRELLLLLSTTMCFSVAAAHAFCLLVSRIACDACHFRHLSQDNMRTSTAA